MPKKSSDSSSTCSCRSEDAKYVDFSEAESMIQEIKADLHALHNELHANIVKYSCPEQTTRACKIKNALVKLQMIDNRMLYVQNLIQVDASDDDLVSNFGQSVKLDEAKERLNKIKIKHENLRKEWYCQEEHLNKLAGQIQGKENELRLQSIYCTTQGLILSKMLWKSSNFCKLLDTMVANDKLALEVIKTLDGCLYAFTQTYADEMPDPSAAEYQYVLCLCGVVSNLASVPDGRFLLVSQPVCRGVYDQMIRILPNILVPQAEDLKWIILTSIYNIMICKKGEEYAKSNKELLQSLAECITPSHSEKIIVLTLKIMSALTSDVSNKTYMNHVSSCLPVKRLEELQKSKDSVIIRKQANSILSSIIRLSNPNPGGKEELIGTTPLDESKSKCQVACTQTNKKKNQEVLAYYVFTDSHKRSNPQSSASEPMSDDEFFQSSSASYSLSNSSPSSYDSRTTYSNRSSTHRYGERVHPHSAPVESRGRRSDVSPPSPASTIDDSTQFVDYESKVDVTTKYPVNVKFDNDPSSKFCRPSTFSMPAKPIEPTSQAATTPSQSEEIQNFQYQFPHINVNKFFSITIGDNIQNSRRNNRNVGTAFPDGENNTSIITVFRIRSSKALMPSDNSFAPYYSTISTNTSFPCDSTMGGLFAIKNGKGNPAPNTKYFAASRDINANTGMFDVAYGGYSCPEQLLQYDNQLPTKLISNLARTSNVYDDGSVPSTSTGYYGYEESVNPFVSIPDVQASSSSLLIKPEKELLRSEADGKSSSKKGRESGKCSSKKLGKCANKANKWPFGRIFNRQKK